MILNGKGCLAGYGLHEDSLISILFFNPIQLVFLNEIFLLL